MSQMSMRPLFREPENAFTLIEMLIVISILAVLAAVLTPAVNASISSGQRVSTLSNMRQFGLALTTFLADSNGDFPLDKGTSDDKWSTALSGQNDSAWYNVLPRVSGAKGVGDYAANAAGKAEFYSRRSLFFNPVAKYPADKLTASTPYFAIAMNSKLIQANTQSRMTSVARPAQTVAFLENGLPAETKFRSTQSTYNLSLIHI